MFVKIEYHKVDYYDSFMDSCIMHLEHLKNLCQRRWIKFLNDYDMKVHYHPGKENVVAYDHSRLSIVSVCHVEEEKYELVNDVHRLDGLEVRLVNI